MRGFYNYAPLILAILGILVGLTGYYLDIILQIKSLLWAGIALMLSIVGFTTGRLIHRLDLSSHTDSVTGLWNRRYFCLRLAEEEARALRKKAPLCVAMIDIDDFKTINDKYGHAAGDLLLSDLAAIFKNNVQPTNIVARWGGDEFAIIFSGTSLLEAYAVMERIRHKIEARFSSSYGLAISAGVILLEPGQTLQDLLLTADRALYKAKAKKNLVITLAELPC
ncbi:GGDEF domain-containing protein [Sporomusa sp. KB1]|uniref:GGDEF domain-containing protein n=1 Tax=Sporomusa sp. KB1 TaxID=943346 RepID=UPI0011ACA947|nr:GGDEF domain-containing protein [Sporomusa sp. KB1]TWH47764.1 diguanylate cyclase (GGDEF)-like protein [Sporomusa sp. KB1]